MSDKKHNAFTGGIVLITLGVLIYLSKSGSYSFGQTWPVLLIAIGICTIIQKIRDFGGWFIILAGVAFLFYESYGFDLSQYSKYLLPALLILLGIFVIIRRKK
jgi:cadmium resistance protein CadD (predicted permease)